MPVFTLGENCHFFGWLLDRICGGYFGENNLLLSGAQMLKNM